MGSVRLEKHSHRGRNPLLLQSESSPPPPDVIFDSDLRTRHRTHGRVERCSTCRRRRISMNCVVILLAISCIVLGSYIFYQAIWSKLNPKPEICITAKCVQIAGDLMAAMDTSVDPCTDFYSYSCGSWDRDHPLPVEKFQHSMFDELKDKQDRKLRDLIEANITAADTAATITAKRFYKTCIDIDQIRKTGNAMFFEIFKKLGEWPIKEPQSVSNFSLEYKLAEVREMIGRTFEIIFKFSVDVDDKNSSRYVLKIDQGDLVFPARDYYLPDKAAFRPELHMAYKTLLVKTAQIYNSNLSSDEMWKRANRTYEIEKHLASLMADPVRYQNSEERYKLVTLGELKQKVPYFDFELYLNKMFKKKFLPNEPIVIYAYDYVINSTRYLASLPKEDVAGYIMWRIMYYFLPSLTGPYQDAVSEFKYIMLGTLRREEPWRQCLELIERYLGMAIGRLFVLKHFDEQRKLMGKALIEELKKSFIDLLDHNEWMDDATLRVAHEKAEAIYSKVGYPDYILNKTALDKIYENVTVNDSNFMWNMIHINKLVSEAELRRLRYPVDRNEWNHSPVVINAYYDPNTNQAHFPAGILQPMFYSSSFPQSMNFGAIGVVIGHEITHGFDDNGRKFDKFGNLKQWWDNTTIERFSKAAQCIVDQYSNYVVKDVDININGELTRSENIADNGGLKQAFLAYKRWSYEHEPEPLLPGIGLNHDQLFFLNFAQIWCGNRRREATMYQMTVSEHTVNEYRVIGTLSNSHDFAKAFNCPRNSPMNPDKKCSVW